MNIQTNIKLLPLLAMTIIIGNSYQLVASSPIKVAVFCGADDKVCDQFKAAAYNLGRQLGTNNFGLVTGGSRTGLMNEITNGYMSTLANPQHLHGVIPQVLAQYDIHHRSIPQENIRWTKTIHTRLATFHELTDAIIVLPGGFGTLHELMDFLVHRQFGLNKKPIILFNPNGFWNSLLMQFNIMIEQKLLSPKHMEVFAVVSCEDECIQVLTMQDQFTSQHGLNSHYWEQK